uniref:530_247_1 protein n=1 Tax=Mamestra configurata TaxID=174822 RepID=F6K724_9NEOP|nr:530_247_1 protein [Mamestra configurata]
MIILLLLALSMGTNAFAAHITVYGDVHKDVDFFTRTFPWIIDNIGGELYVEYYLLGSGRYSVPQTCAVRELLGNTFLQAQYLRCEAEGYPSEYCLCEAGINPEFFKTCVAQEGYLASSASSRFSELGINITPIVDLELLENSTVYGVDDVSFLQKICTIFGDRVPRGCVHYSNQTDSFLAQKALAQFDRACQNEFPIANEPVSRERRNQ